MTDTSSSSSSSLFANLRRQIEGRIHAWYRHQLGHDPVKVHCQIFDNKLVIVLDNAVTQPERLLMTSGRLEFTEQVRATLDRIFRPHLQHLIETLMSVQVVDILTATQLETERTSIVVILSEAINPETLTVNLAPLNGQADGHVGE
jgi:uncharacterized protein YbcI